MDKKILIALFILSSCTYFKDCVYLFEINEESFLCEKRMSTLEYDGCVNIKTKEQFSSIYITELIPVKVKSKGDL